MIENEFKIMLTKEQYEKLLAAYEWDETIIQTNYYYDTPDLQLSIENITCRVREKNGVFDLQMKLPTAKDYIRVEVGKRLKVLPDTLYSDELLALAGEAMPDVSKLGGLTTNRSVKKFDECEIDLDRSEYFDKTDYELEIEFSEETPARKLLNEICGMLDLHPESDVCPGKLHRFLDEFSRRNSQK